MGFGRPELCGKKLEVCIGTLCHIEGYNSKERRILL